MTMWRYSSAVLLAAALTGASPMAGAAAERGKTTISDEKGNPIRIETLPANERRTVMQLQKSIESSAMSARIPWIIQCKRPPLRCFIVIGTPQPGDTLPT